MQEVPISNSLTLKTGGQGQISNDSTRINLGTEVTLVLLSIIVSFNLFLAATTGCAQVSVVGASTSTSSTTAGARKSFFDSNTNLHWVFWYNGSAIEYASSSDASEWSSRGTLSYNTENFSVAFKVISGTSYVFVASEANTYDIVMRRGFIAGATVTFDNEATVLDGTSASDKYIRPHIALDSNDKVWTAAFKDLGSVGNRYSLTARRTSDSGDQTLVFDPAASLGNASMSVSSVTMVPTAPGRMLAAVSGESGRNVTAYEYNGSSWGAAGLGGEYGVVPFARAGMDGPVFALAFDASGNLYAGGQFSRAGNTSARNIAKWDGSSWSALGDGTLGQVNALVFDSNGHLYVGGAITSAGGVSVSNIAKWDGTSWSPLGAGTNDYVWSLAFDTAGTLYAGGRFTTAGGVSAARIAKWDGSSWSALGSGLNDQVFSIAGDSNGNIYAAGAFTTAGGASAPHIAKWDGSSWSSLGAGISASSMSAVAVDTNGTVYAAGYFSIGGGGAAYRVAAWSGSSWSALGAEFNGSISRLALDGNGNIYAGGFFTTVGGATVNYIAKWSGNSWSALGAGLRSDPYTIAVDSSGKIFAVTPPYLLDQIIHQWDGSSWRMVESGLYGVIYSVVIDTSGNLYVGGGFSAIGGTLASNIAKWDGQSWSALGGGLNSAVFSLAADGNGNLYVGGNFSTAGGVSANNIAKWDGTAWSALGTGVNGPADGGMVIGPNGALYVGGCFGTAGGVSANNIAVWNGNSWEALGSGFGDPNSAYLVTLAFDRSGNLYTGGYSSTGENLTRWDGTAWSVVGGTFDGEVRSVALDLHGNLYAGGYFSTVGGVTADGLAKWDGTSWSAVGGLVNSTVQAIRIDVNGELYVGGEFTIPGDSSPSYLAKWDGTNWSRFSALSSSVYGLSLDANRNPYVVTFPPHTLSYLQPMAATNQLSGSAASLVADASGVAHLSYIDTNSDLLVKSYAGSSWGNTSTIATGTVESVASSYYTTSTDLVAWFTEGGSVKYVEASAPYSSWSAPTILSSDGNPKGVSSVANSGGHSQIVAIWNRAGDSAGEVVSTLLGAAPTPTPTITPTPTLTPTAPPDPTHTPSPTYTPAGGSNGEPTRLLSAPSVKRSGRNVIVSFSATSDIKSAVTCTLASTRTLYARASGRKATGKSRVSWTARFSRVRPGSYLASCLLISPANGSISQTRATKFRL